MRCVLALCFVALMAGCAAPSIPPSPEQSATVPTVTHSTALANCTTAQFQQCIESTIGVDGKGRMYVANEWGNDVAVSLDNGTTWERRDAPALPADVVPVVTDNDALVRGTPRGRAVYVAIADESPGNILLGLHIAVSDDGAKTWPVNQVISVDANHRVLGADRPWVAEGRDGALYLTFTDLTTSQLKLAQGQPCTCEYLGDVLRVARSDDGGTTWGPFIAATPEGGGAEGGDIAVTSAGEVVMAAIIGPADLSARTLVLLRSQDRGQTWHAQTVTGPGPESALPDARPSFAAAPNGTEAVAWQAGQSLVVSVRPSGTAPWPAPMTWSLPDEAIAAWPALAPMPSGWALSYATERSRANGTAGNFTLVLGGAKGPVDRILLAGDVPLPGGGANSDFATIAVAINGDVAATITHLQPGTPPSGLPTGGHIEVVTVKPG